MLRVLESSGVYVHQQRFCPGHCTEEATLPCFLCWLGRLPCVFSRLSRQERLAERRNLLCARYLNRIAASQV